MSSSYQINLQHLPSEILTRIFAFLTFRQRIRLERVCREWRQAALDLAWRDVRTLKLGRLSAILRRCGPNLEELHLGPGIGVQTRFGRYFPHLAVHQKLTHLRIDDNLDIWHLRQIGRHLGPQLISLSINLDSRKKKRKLVLKGELAEMLGNCQKLECFCISKMTDLFIQREGRMNSFLPKSIKYLQIWHEDNWDESIKIGLVDKFSVLLSEQNFPKFRFFLTNFPFALNEMLGREPKIYERFYSLTSPFLFAPNHSFLQLNFPHFLHLQALHLNFHADHVFIPIFPNIHFQLALTQLAQFCPQLAHLDFNAHYAAGWGERAPLRELEGLYGFRRLSSLAISIELRHFDDFHELKCTTGEFADHVLMEIITNLNQIHPIRSLDFKAHVRNQRYYPNFYEEFILEMVEKLSHLETFSCALEPHICYFCLPFLFPENPFHKSRICWDQPNRIDFEEFFEKLKKILEEQMQEKMGNSKRNKIFKFTLVGSGGRPLSKISAKWNPKIGKISRKTVPIIRKYDSKIYPAKSIVLDEILGQVMDKRTQRILFEFLQ